MTESQELERDWSERGLLAFREMLGLMTPVARSGDVTLEQRDTLAMLLTSSARSSESVFLLTAYGQLWDAEIVLRSVFEGTLKFIFMLESKADFADRHIEYAHDLWEISLIKDHQKAADLLSSVPTPESPEWQPIRERLLPLAELEALRSKHDRTRRRELETKWGFTNLLNSLSRQTNTPLRQLAGLAWSYSLMSHLQHADFVGAMLPLERDMRSTERRDSIHRAHLARLIVDTLTSMVNRLTIGYIFADENLEPVVQALSKVDAIRKSFGGAYEHWMEIEYGKQQDPKRS